MKKLLSLILTGIIAVGMVGCSVEENAEDSSEKQVKQEQKQEVKKEQANQDTENSKKETTKKDNNSNNTSKENNTKKQTDKNIENTKEANDQICYICGEFVPVSDMTDIDGKVAHNECVGVSKSNGDEDEEDDYYAPIGTCAKCGADLYRYDAEYYNKNGDQICYECRFKPDYTCSQCGKDGYDDDGYYTDDNGNRICFECSCANWERKEVDDEMVDEDTYNEYN